MENIRVLVISSKYPPEYSGSGLRAHTTYKRLSRKFNIHFDVLCSSVISNKNCVYRYDDVKVKRIANKLFLLPSLQQWEDKPIHSKIGLRINYFTEALPTFKYFYKYHHKYDLVHVFGNVAVTSAAITFCNLTKKPLIVELTYDVTIPQQYKPFLIKLFDRDPSGFHSKVQIVCISKKLEDNCRKRGIYQNIWTRPNPIDKNIFCVERIRKYEYRKKNSKFGKGDTLLVNISKFMPIKNQIFLLEVLRFLPSNYKLLLGGPLVRKGPNYYRDYRYMERINNAIKEYRLQDRVQIIPEYIEKPHEYIKMSDVYVFPSKIEALGTPMIESICCGVPVVATRIDGVTDVWIRDGENGFISNLEPREFARKIQLAAKIDQSILDAKSKEVISIANTDYMDLYYYNIIKRLIQ